MLDTAQHMAGKKPFCKIDCLRDYHCLQIAECQCKQRLPFNFASQTITYRSLAQGLSRLLSAFSKSLREYLDKKVKCAQNVHDIGIVQTTESSCEQTSELFLNAYANSRFKNAYSESNKSIF